MTSIRHARANPRRGQPAALLALLWLSGGMAGPGWAQDSVSPSAGGNDALSPYEAAHQRRSYVVDLVPVATSWGKRVAVGPILKASRSLEAPDGGAPPTNILGSTAVSPGTLGPIATTRTFSVWSAPGQGANPSVNTAASGTATPTSFDRQFCVGITDFGAGAGGALPTNISGAIVGARGAEPRRLFVERTYAINSRNTPTTEDAASLTLGAVDPSGGVYLRGDDFLSLFPTLKVLGENIVRVNLSQRTVDPSPTNAFAINFLLKDLFTPSNQGWDNASTTVLVNNPITANVGESLVCPIAPAQVLSSAGPVIGNVMSADFSGGFRAGSSVSNVVSVTGAIAPGIVGLRGNPSYSITDAGAAPAALPAFPAGAAAMLGTTLNANTPEARSLAPINSISVFGLHFPSPGGAPAVIAGSAKRATLALGMTDSANPAVTAPVFAVNIAGSAQFAHALSQTPFRGPSGQVAIGQLGAAAGGDLLVAATAFDANATPAGGEFIAVKRFVAGASATDHWVVVAHPGKRVLTGPNGADIGGLLSRTALGEPAAMSSPAMDLLGNVYFVSRWQPATGPSAGTTQTGLFKGVLTQVDAPAAPNASGLTYRLELLLTTGQSILGANSATTYTIEALRLADSNSGASGGFHAGQVIQARPNRPGQSSPTADPKSPFAFGGCAVNATVRYDAPGGAQRYEATLFVGPFKSLLGDINDDGFCDFLDLNLVLSDFGQTGAGLAGDANGDGVCDFVDLNIVLSDFGTAEP